MIAIGRAQILAAGALAVAACSKGSLTPADSGTTGVGGTVGGCTRADEYITCTGDAGPPPLPFDDSPCTLDGVHCQGFACNDSFGGTSWGALCCAGRWWTNFSGICPPSLQPGEPFSCGADLSCAAFQTYCSASNPERTATWSYSCQPICPAGDCSCFCDKPEGCTFQPPGSACPADLCTCSTLLVGPGIPRTGAIQVECRSLVPGTIGSASSGACYRDAALDGQCGFGSRAMLCEGPAVDRGAMCVALPDSVITASCGAVEVHDYCCSS